MEGTTAPPVGAASGLQRARVGVVGRAALAAILAAAVCDGLWRLLPQRLTVTTDIVGYPIFSDFDPNRYSDAFYLVGLVFPLMAAAFFTFLPIGTGGRRRSPRVPVRPVRLIGSGQVGLDTTDDDAGDVTGDDAGDADHRDDDHESAADVLRLNVLRRGVRVLVPAGAVAACVGVAGSGRSPHMTGWSLAAGAVYAVGVPVVARSLLHRGARGDAARLLATVNGAAAMVVLPLLYLVSRGTSVVVETGHQVKRYPWLPLWLLVPVLGAVVWWYARRLARAASTEDVIGAEGSVLTYVVGPALLFVLIASLSGPLDVTFFGFDDAHTFTTAHLTFAHGLFPWRDLFFIHGVYPDILAGQLGMSVFDASRWGSTAGVTMFLIPSLWLSLYVFAAYFGRRNRLLAAGLVAVTALWLTGERLAGAGLALGRDVQAYSSGSYRFAFVPLVLVLFDQTLRRRSPAWCAALMAALVAQAILVPETAIMAGAMLLTLMVFEWAGRAPGARWAPSLARTWWCAGFGVLFVSAWVVFLAATGALAGFVDYFRIFWVGHALQDAFPATFIGSELGPTVELVVPVVLIAVTIWRLALMLGSRRPWATRDWVLMSTAIFVTAFYQKVLTRPDEVHVAEVFTVSLPLVLLWAVILVEWMDAAVHRGAGRRRRSEGTPRTTSGRDRIRSAVLAIRHPATLVIVVALVALAPGAVGTVTSVAGRYHVTVPSEPSLRRLGYAVPGVIDTTMVHDLDAVLRRYAGTSAPVFDFNDEPGLLYYLLNRMPGTRFYNVSQADSGSSQRQLVADLAHSRPPLVVFYGEGIGLPSWDGIEATVRHYIVSDYLLSRYRPLVDVDGQFVMIRSDLAPSAPPLPAVAGTATTQELYLANPECDWGFAPDFLARPTSLRAARRLAVPTHVISASAVLIGGWSVDVPSGEPPPRVLAVRDGREVASVVPNGIRLDVSQRYGSPLAVASGFTIDLPAPMPGPVALYALHRDGTVSPIAPAHSVPGTLVVRGGGAQVTTADGRTHRVQAEGAGAVDEALVTNERLVALDVPPGTDLGTYHWLELRSAGGFAPSHFSVADGRDQSPGAISFRSLPRAGADLYVQVGSCPQWRGFTASGLTLIEAGGRPSPPVVRLVR